MLDGAKALAMTVADLWAAPDTLARARQAHESVRADGGREP